MAYASLAGLAPQYGMYASMVALVAYAVFGTSRQLSVGVTSALSIMIAGTLGAMAFASPGEYLAAAQFTAIVAGVIALIAGLFRLGFVVNFISESVLVGFSAGAALFIGSSQIAKLFGIEGVQGNFFERIGNVIRNIGETNFWTLGLGVVSILALLFLEERFPRLPAALMVVIVAIIIMVVSNLESRGVEVAGTIPGGLPVPSIPIVDGSSVTTLVGLGFGCFLLSYIEGVGAARTFATRHKYQIDANQELIANGAANLAAGVMQGYSVGGSMSRSAVNDKSGAKTPAASLVAAVILAVVLLFLTGPFSYLPETTLAAIVLIAVRSLVNVPAITRLFNISRPDFLAALFTFFGVLVFGMLEGIIIGVLFSFLALLRRISRPHTALLGRIPGTSDFVDVARNPNTEVLPDVLVFRADAGLFYANAPLVTDDLLAAVERRELPPRLVVLDMEATPLVDLGAAETLVKLRQELSTRAIDLRLANVHGEVRDVLARTGEAAQLGGIPSNASVSEVVAQWQAEGASQHPPDSSTQGDDATTAAIPTAASDDSSPSAAPRTSE
jgi:high affinity sulfate transporter 1